MFLSYGEVIHTVRLQDTEDLVTCRKLAYRSTSKAYKALQAKENMEKKRKEQKHTSNNLDLSDTVRVTENDADLRRGSTLLGHLADQVDNLLRSGLQPRRRSTGVGNRRGRNALALRVKTTHFCCV